MFNFGWKPQTIVPSFFGISSDPAAAITKAKTETNKPQAQCPYLIVSSVQIGPTDSPQTLKFGIREARPSDISPAAKRACSYYKGPQNQPTTENFAGDENAFSPLRDGAAQNDDRGAAMETEDSILTESGILRETRMLDHFEYSSIFGEGLGSILTQMNHRFGVSTPQHVYKEPEGPVQDYRDDVYKFCWGVSENPIPTYERELYKALNDSSNRGFLIMETVDDCAGQHGEGKGSQFLGAVVFLRRPRWKSYGNVCTNPGMPDYGSRYSYYQESMKLFEKRIAARFSSRRLGTPTQIQWLFFNTDIANCAAIEVALAKAMLGSMEENAAAIKVGKETTFTAIVPLGKAWLLNCLGFYKIGNRFGWMLSEDGEDDFEKPVVFPRNTVCLIGLMWGGKHTVRDPILLM